MKQLSWTEVADFLEKFSEFERGSEGKMCVGQFVIITKNKHYYFLI